MNQTVITVRLCNENYKIKCEKSQVETLQAAAELLSSKISSLQESSKLSTSNATLLTALNLCGEQLTQEKQNSFSNEQKNRLNQLNQKITTLLSD